MYICVHVEERQQAYTKNISMSFLLILVSHDSGSDSVPIPTPSRQALPIQVQGPIDSYYYYYYSGSGFISKAMRFWVHGGGHRSRAAFVLSICQSTALTARTLLRSWRRSRGFHFIGFVCEGTAERRIFQSSNFLS